MVASVTTGDAQLQTIPTFGNTYEQQGRGSCGGQTYSVTKTDGSSAASFMSISGSQITLMSTDTGSIGQYTIRLTATMEDYTSIQTTTDFIVRLLVLGSGPTFASTQSLEVGEGPYTVANSCYTEPDFGYTLVLGMSTSEASLPDFVTYDSGVIAVIADPVTTEDGETSFSVSFTCYLDEVTAEIPTYTEIVNFTGTGVGPVCPGDPDCPPVEPVCPGDPECQPVCPGDPECEPVCPGDPECEPVCPGDPECEPVCPGDPDCPTVEPICPGDPDCPTVEPICPGDPSCEPICPDSANSDCPICPNPHDLTDTTCPGHPFCILSFNPDCSIEEEEDELDDEEDEPDISEFEIHQYYIPSGEGPLLEDLFAPVKTLRSQFELIGTG